MILFVSGRCDICAYYSNWFFKRLEEGFVDVRNPFDPHQISRIILDERNIDMILFCTKNPLPMLSRLDRIAFPYMFHVTLTPYQEDVEINVHHKKAILDGILQLSERIGKENVIVRYDPILLTKQYNMEYHEKAFAYICEALSSHVSRIIISFVDLYKNTRKNMEKMQMETISEGTMREMGKRLGRIAEKYKIRVCTCAEDIDLSSYHIEKGNCVERVEIEQRIGHALSLKGKGVRKECSCIPAVDIGDYNCCSHGCLYCYANYDEESITDRMRQHDPESSVLIGHVEAGDRIKLREDASVKQEQLF